MSERRRFLLGLAEISGYWSRMEAGLREIGCDADFVSLDAHPYDYGDSLRRPNPLVAAIRAVRRRKSRVAVVAEVPLRAALLVWAIARYDVFVFGYHTTFFQTRDLAWLRRCGKTIVMVFHGSDERPPYIDGYVDHLAADDLGTTDLAALTDVQKERILRCGTYADLVVANPNSGQFHERRVMTYHVLGNPVSSPRAAAPGRPGTSAERTIRVLHAPSKPSAKGTPLIREVCRTLRDEGLDIELVEAQGLRNDELHDLILDCDAVVDQAYGDCTWAMLAAEASFLGRPVVVGGYGHEHLRSFLPDGMVPPGVYVAPDELGTAIRRLAEDDEYRLAVGADAATFAAANWRPAQVARRLLAALDGTAPDDWFHDPADIRYLWGGGITDVEVRRRLRYLRERHGEASWRLEDKPELAALARELAG